MNEIAFIYIYLQIIVDWQSKLRYKLSDPKMNQKHTRNKRKTEISSFKDTWIHRFPMHFTGLLHDRYFQKKWCVVHFSIAQLILSLFIMSVYNNFFKFTSSIILKSLLVMMRKMNDIILKSFSSFINLYSRHYYFLDAISCCVSSQTIIFFFFYSQLKSDSKFRIFHEASKRDAECLHQRKLQATREI